MSDPVAAQVAALSRQVAELQTKPHLAEMPLELFAFDVVLGATKVLPGNVEVWNFANAVDQIIGLSLRLPDSWAGGNAIFDFLLAGSAAVAGNVKIGGGLYFFRPGLLLDMAPDVSWSPVQAIPATAKQLVLLSIAASLASYQVGDFCYTTFARLGGDAADTYTGALYLAGAHMRKS